MSSTTTRNFVQVHCLPLFHNLDYKGALVYICSSQKEEVRMYFSHTCAEKQNHRNAASMAVGTSVRSHKKSFLYYA